ncbi:hypothetical protein Ahy_A08g039061 [Arachis hypogaea]|uniref:PB1-like domain-containing protein n=1 Tax=Arachis hypogaea TaxID=3818 RepID=A0A445BV57_ARAHY|nr:hypothetical protein Ahy_A08g039061 [Arachis hypogaea]
MATIHITLCINHRGRFKRGPGGTISYTGGEVTEINRVNVDTLNGFFITDLLKDIGYTSVSNFYWQESGMELDDGLRDLRVDMDVVRMYEAAVKNGNKINVYTEHPVDQAVIVEENNMTLSKRRCSMRPVPSQEFWEHLDTLPILPPRYRKPIGRPSYKRDKRNDTSADKSDPHKTKRRIGTIVCKFCLQAGHNKRTYKKRKVAMGEGSAPSQVPEGDNDDDMMAEMFWEETVEAVEAEAAATEDGNDSTTPHPAQGIPPPTTTQHQPPTNNATIRKQVKRRSVKRPPPTAKTHQTHTPSANKPTTTPSTHNSETTAHPLQGASAGTSRRFVQFMPTPGVTTGATGRGTAARGGLHSRGRGRKGAFSGSKTGVSSGSSNSTPL